MKIRLISLVLSLTVAANCFPCFAFETDQYNLPPVPLADIGDEVSDYVEETVARAVDKVNEDIAAARSCIVQAGRPRGCGTIGEERKRLAFLLSDDAVGREVYNQLGGSNILVTKFGKWLLSHKFRAHPSSYKTSYRESIYLALPTDYLTISPTIKLYGVEFGVDKLEHLFQQGYKYNEIRKRAEGRGSTTEDAARKAVRWGQRTERTYFGTLVSGVYSNADLYANYAGMKFYQGMTKPLVMGETTRPATVLLRDGKWQLNKASLDRDTLLKPFLTEHLNEAFNPSGYAIGLFTSVRRIVKSQSCAEWQALYPTLSRSDVNERTRALELWYGEDYGFTKKKRSISIGDECFAEPAGPGSVPVAAA